MTLQAVAWEKIKDLYNNKDGKVVWDVSAQTFLENEFLSDEYFIDLRNDDGRRYLCTEILNFEYTLNGRVE